MAWRKAGPIAVLAAALVGCGGRAQNRAEGSAAGGADPEVASGGTLSASSGAPNSANGGAGSPSAAGAAGPLGSGGLSGLAGASAGNSGGTAGAPVPTSHPARACSNPVPRAQGGGYLACDDGSLRRPSAGTCSSSLPRAAPDLPLALSECTSDTDCTSAAHGFCAYGACKYGCINDDECASTEACFCGAAIGVCVPAQCRSDADCPAGFPCSGYVRPGFTDSDLACQTAADECLTDPQCYSLNPRVTCRFQVDHRVCLADTVG